MRRKLAFLAVLFATSLQGGCAAIQHPPAIDDSDVSSPHDIRVVAVRPPTLRYIDPVDDQLGNEIRESAHLIRALRGTGLFDKVDYSTEVGCPVDIEISAVPGDYPRLTGAPWWLYFATLSIAIIDSREGVAFYPVDDPDDRIEIEYRTRMFIGIGALLASPVLLTGLIPDWYITGTDPKTGDGLRSRLAPQLRKVSSHRGNATALCETGGAP